MTLATIRDAAARISAVAYKTPLIRLPLQEEVYAKAESLQRTNSFKFRGAYNFLASMTEADRKKGVVAPSSGNHAQGLACAAHLFGIPAVLAIPEGAPEIKVERTRAWGAEIVRCGGSTLERNAAAQQIVDERGYTFVPPFDHPWIIAGQGTSGLELANAMPDVANVLVCTGGGGLLAGISVAVKALCPEAQIIGVEPELAADASESFATGERVTWSAEKTTRTIADGVRTQQLGQHTFALIKEHVDGFITVSEAEIIEAARWYLHEAKVVVEPTGALTLAAYQKLFAKREPSLKLKPGKTVVLISGGNVAPEFLKSLF